MDSIFMRHGFKVKIIDYDEIAKNLGKQPAPEDYRNLLFVAEHLRLSDDQVRQTLL